MHGRFSIIEARARAAPRRRWALTNRTRASKIIFRVICALYHRKSMKCLHVYSDQWEYFRLAVHETSIDEGPSKFPV